MRFLVLIMVAALGCTDTQPLLPTPDAECSEAGGGDAGSPRDATTGGDSSAPRADSSPDGAAGDSGPPPDASPPRGVPPAPPALMETCLPGIGGHDLAIGPDGTIVIAGYFRRTIAFGDEEFVAVERDDGIVAALSAEGVPRWATPLGGRQHQAMRAVDVSSAGEITAVGFFQSEIDVGGTRFVSAEGFDGVVAQLSPSGTVSWTRQLGGTGRAYASDVRVMGTETVIAGTYSGELLLGLGMEASMPPALATDAFVARFDGSGTALSARGFGGGGADRPSSLAVTAAGRTVMVGMLHDVVRDSEREVTVSTAQGFAASWDGTEADENFVELYTNKVTVDAVDVSTDGELVIAGSFEEHGTLGTGPLAGAAESGIFIARLTSSGRILWARGFAGTGFAGNSRDVSVSFAADGRIVATGALGLVDFGDGPLRASGSLGDVYVGWLTADGEVITAYVVESEIGPKSVPHVVTEDGILWLAIDQLYLSSLVPDAGCIGLRILALPPPG